MHRSLVEFLQDSFDSVWSLEILLALRREPDRSWKPEEIVDELRSSRVVVGQSLDRLLAAGLVLVEEDGGVRYSPHSLEEDRLVEQLDEAYRVKPSAVRRLIIHSPVDKLRSFSDAFRIIKD